MVMQSHPARFILGLLLAGTAMHARAEITLPAVFSDHMVLQRDRSNPVWGRAEPGETVTVTIAGQSHTANANAAGEWRTELDPLPAGGPYSLTISGMSAQQEFTDVLVGEVWICSGQSNMFWPLAWIDFSELEIASAHQPQIRLLTVPERGTQTPQFTFEGQWQVCSPQSVSQFSALGYLFGKRLHDALGVPVGLINTSWGGASIAGWIPRDKYAVDDYHARQLQSWDARAAATTDADQQAALGAYERELDQWKNAGSSGRAPRKPLDPRYSRDRPGNIFNGMLSPLRGYGIRGVIWYQGESNISHPYHYRTSFPLMIECWREAWGQGDFPFYWVQLPNHGPATSDPTESEWAELREAQSLALRLPHTGQAITIDTAEGRNLHPRNKQLVADRLVVLPLRRDYGVKVDADSPTYASMEVRDNKMVLTFDHVDLGLYAYDTEEPLGFAIAGEDEAYVRAQAEIINRNQIAVWSESVPHPANVRYAWADNPVANIQDRNGLPLAPFRTDDHAAITRHD